MIVTIKNPNRGIILHANRIGLDCSLLAIESEGLACEIPLKELEVRVLGRAALVASGRFRIELPEDCVLAVWSKEQRVEIEVAGGGLGKFSVTGGMVWVEAISA